MPEASQLREAEQEFKALGRVLVPGTGRSRQSGLYATVSRFNSG